MFSQRCYEKSFLSPSHCDSHFWTFCERGIRDEKRSIRYWNKFVQWWELASVYRRDRKRGGSGREGERKGGGWTVYRHDCSDRLVSVSARVSKRVGPRKTPLSLSPLAVSLSATRRKSRLYVYVCGCFWVYVSEFCVVWGGIIQWGDVELLREASRQHTTLRNVSYLLFFINQANSTGGRNNRYRWQMNEKTI